MDRIKFTEYLLLDLEEDVWRCEKCNKNLISCYENYKKGCLVNEKDPTEVHPPLVNEEINFAPDPSWIRILEFYCPECGTQLETEYLPPGHPITHDIEIDISKLKERIKNGEYKINNMKLEVNR